jgi:hypothetical protein
MLYELKVLQAGVSVLIDHIIFHRNMINGLLEGCMISLGICECSGAKKTRYKMMILIGRVLAFPVPSVVPDKGG